MNETKIVTLVKCPRCGSIEFCIEETIYEATQETWILCRQCDWTMGELPKLNKPVIKKEKT